MSVDNVLCLCCFMFKLAHTRHTHTHVTLIDDPRRDDCYMRRLRVLGSWLPIFVLLFISIGDDEDDEKSTEGVTPLYLNAPKTARSSPTTTTPNLHFRPRKRSILPLTQKKNQQPCVAHKKAICTYPHHRFVSDQTWSTNLILYMLVHGKRNYWLYYISC